MMLELEEKESLNRIQELLNTGYDVLIREYERGGDNHVMKKPTARRGDKGTLMTQCHDQDEPVAISTAAWAEYVQSRGC